MSSSNRSDPFDVAIVGMACRFPGAQSIDEFWRNLRAGVESISFFSDQELEAEGVPPAVLSNPNYVKAGGVLDNVESFDAAFFGYFPREAELMDPQQRFFLECAWTALEDAGYNSENYKGQIGVYAGSRANTYLLNNLYRSGERFSAEDSFQTLTVGEGDYLATRVSYKLNLRGPSMGIQSACSTSLVAVHVACQALLNGECDIALAGGVSIRVPQKTGYLYRDGDIVSPDGHCRAFDSKAQGTVFGSGVGIVVLKRLADAVTDGDNIHAVIKGSAVNNDGAFKIGYTAPAAEGQAQVIAEALDIAGIDPATVTYVEAHGTGTPLGDPIEIAALTQAYRARTAKRGFCAVGSVKTNIGHTSTAAGVAGLIKTVLALKHKLLLPSLHFQQPNPKIDFENSPFYVNTKLSEWDANGAPRRAGVSSFGIGGTNAHVVIEEARDRGASSPSRPWQLLLLSAKASAALDTATTNLAQHLKQHPDLNLADVAYTLKIGRPSFNHRRLLVSQDNRDALNTLQRFDPERVFTSVQKFKDRNVVFMFPGQGSQYVKMALELYQVEPVFREQVVTCAELLKPRLGLDLRGVLYPPAGAAEKAAQQLNETALSQPALFVIEYAVATLLMDWRIRPEAMIGHSLGEYVAACLAGVFSLEDALSLVATRAQLMNRLPTGSMLAVPLSKEEVETLLSEQISLAAINSPSLNVISGPTEAVENLTIHLAQQGVTCRRLRTSHAFHSSATESALEPLAKLFSEVRLGPPKIPYLSNVTGTWITAAQAVDPLYWAAHMRQTVRFSDGLQELLKDRDRVFVEIGPGQTLSSLVKQHEHKATRSATLSSIRDAHDGRSDAAFLLRTLGQLWLAGVKIDWSRFYRGEQRHRVPLPTYSFERQRFWIEPERRSPPEEPLPLSLPNRPDMADWFYVPSWNRSDLPSSAGKPSEKLSWLLLMDECGLASQLRARLQQQGHTVVGVTIGEKFSRISENLYTMNPKMRDEYESLLEDLRSLKKTPAKIVHLWCVTGKEPSPHGNALLQDLGLHSLLFLAQVLGKQAFTSPLQIHVVSNDLHEVTGEELLCPAKATVLGACKAIPVEYPNMTCRSINVNLPGSGFPDDRLIDALLAELSAKPSDTIVAYRGNHRWVQSLQPVHLDQPGAGTSRLRQHGVYLITGGLGDIGLTLAEHLARTVQAKLILTGRSPFPGKHQWRSWLSTHDDRDPISAKIHKLYSFEAFGAEVLALSADVASPEAMKDVTAQAKDRFGQIHGVIHCAGVPDYAGVIARRSREITESILASKVKGTLVLDSLFQDGELDFLVLCSSLSSIVHRARFGQVGYCAANEFLDAFACAKSPKARTFTVAINWCAWREVGMSAEARKRRARSRITDESQMALAEAMLPSEGVDAFCRILESGLARIAVSPKDLCARVEQDIPQTASLNSFDGVTAATSDHARPELSSAYVAPRNDTERILVDIWQQLLGFERLGIHDNFFDLGGHSLLGTQIVARIRERFNVDLPLLVLFEKPTVAQLALATIVEQVKTADSSTNLLAQIETLPENGAKQMLIEELTPEASSARRTPQT